MKKLPGKKSKPSYVKLSEKDFLKKIEAGKKILGCCTLCGNFCRVNRAEGIKGKCGMDADLSISSYNAHFGEEPPISGNRGSGTVFLTGCCLSCVFCQNYPISQLKNGRKIAPAKLGEKMVELQGRGVHNINFVAPTHQVPQIIEAVYHARSKGLKIPIVYNTGGYDSEDCLKLLDGIVDIYLPDYKYADDYTAMKISGAKNYRATALAAITEMYRQTGDLVTDGKGAGIRGVIIRHLVLPGGLAQTGKVFSAIKKNITTKIHASIMGQYFPTYKALKMDGLTRRITKDEYEQAIKDVLKLGFKDIFRQLINFEEDKAA